MDRPRSGIGVFRRHTRTPADALFRRIFLINGLVFTLGTLVLAVSPATVSARVRVTEIPVLVVGLAVILTANAFLLRSSLAPLDGLIASMRRVDPLRRSGRLDDRGNGDLSRLIDTFNAMVDRLESERTAASASALAAQEGERQRIARELHDEIGQSLTVALLSMKRAVDRSPADVLHSAQETVRACLDSEPDLTVVAEAANGYEAVQQVADTLVDLAILDIAMPRMTGIQAAREINRTHPEVRILMLSMYDNEQYFFESLRVGASGYVLKSVADRDLLEACRATLRGESYLYPGAINSLIRDWLHRAHQGETLPEPVLTPREEEIVKLVAEGYSSREIATDLVISIKTVDRHRANILQKLGLRDRLDLTRYAIRAGLIEP
jgi:DNA-binding NarL/FixJ family response regulator/outer membrane murein-binding lipoprotein Lpp